MNRKEVIKDLEKFRERWLEWTQYDPIERYATALQYAIDHLNTEQPSIKNSLCDTCQKMCKNEDAIYVCVGYKPVCSCEQPSLQINCDKCGKPLTEFGANLYGVPDKDMMCKKTHICKKCYEQPSQEYIYCKIPNCGCGGSAIIGHRDICANNPAPLTYDKGLEEIRKVLRKHSKGKLADNDEEVWIYDLDAECLAVHIRNAILDYVEGKK